MKLFHQLLKGGERALDFLLDFLAITLSFYAAVLIDSSQAPGNSFPLLFLEFSICLIAVFLYGYHNLYQPMRTKRISFFITRIILVHLELVTVLSLLTVFLQPDSYAWYIRWAALSGAMGAVLLIAKKCVMMSILHGLRSNRKNIKYILVVTDSQDMVDEYLEELHSNPQYGYSVIGYIGNLHVVGLPHLGTTADLDRVIREYRPDEVVMAFDTARKKVVTKYISICDDNCVKVLFVPSVCGYLKAPRQITKVGNLPIIDIRSNPLDNFANQTLKRAIDILGSLFLLILTSPLMLVAAIGVRISSPGPILFRQTRVGKNSREFTMYKFRSMRVNRDEKDGWTTEEDPRKTRFGTFLRKYAIDELPQLYNVLIGDMSLVGPRPEVPFYVEKFRKEIPLYMLKHTLRPGITGLAQIKGLRGDTSIQARIEEDINYIENWTLLGDLRILLKTPLHAINRHEKYVEREKKDEQYRRSLADRIYIRGDVTRLPQENEADVLTDPEPTPATPREQGSSGEEAVPFRPGTEEREGERIGDG